MSKYFYITTTLPYINSDPHIGFGLEIVAADVIARWQRLQNKQVFFNTGTDEHGQKIYEIAQKNNLSPQEYAEKQSKKFYQLKETLNLSFDNFIRTTDEKHQKAAQHFWKIVKKKGLIYKKNYQVKYCVGCEMAKTESELINGCCPLHPNKKLTTIDEENYFFKFSQFQNELLNYFNNNPQFVEPKSKMSEIKAFVKNGLQDFSISRIKEKMSWGITVPNDPKHVFYVWFDALINYISSLGWPDNKIKFQKFWPGIQIAGKDNLRQQASMWQAMLLAANLDLSKKILINGFISVNGQKMSKSLNNVISPQNLVDCYGQEATRFLLINLGVFGDDIDLGENRLNNDYKNDLVNCLGNLCSRLAKMSNNCNLRVNNFDDRFCKIYSKKMNNFQISPALTLTINRAKKIDQFLAEKKPWAIEEKNKKNQILTQAIQKLLFVAKHLEPFMPKTKEFIFSHFYQTKIEIIKKPLFPRIKNV